MSISNRIMAGGLARISNLIRIAIAAAMAFMSVAVIGDVAIAAPAGSISGCVQSDNGTPIWGAHVVAYGWNTGMFAGEANTTENGTYNIADVTSGRYGVKADAAGYFSEYYSEGGTVPVIVFPACATVNIDFTLTPGSSISGHVYQADGLTPIGAARVVAYSKVGGVWEYAADSYADSDGSYSVTTGTGAGIYRVKAEGRGYAAEYYSTGADPTEVIEICLTAGGNIEGVDFRLSQTGYISGTTCNADGTIPISGGHVVAYDNVTGSSVGEGFSEANGGFYYINLNPGTYRLRAEAAGYVAEWYADATTFSGATCVSVDGLNEAPYIKFTLEPVMSLTTLRAFDITETSARLTGQLTSLGSANEVVVSFLWKPATGSYTHETAGQVRNSEGYFSFNLTGLAPGGTYLYRAAAVGDADSVYGEERSFTTIDETAPVVSEPICRTTSSVATIMWAGDEVTKSQIDYGLTEDYDMSTGWSADFVTGHTVKLTHLRADSTYHYRITCKDRSGNETVSGDHVFTTDATSTTVALLGMPLWTAAYIGLAVVSLVMAVYIMICGRFRKREGGGRVLRSDRQT